MNGVHAKRGIGKYVEPRSLYQGYDAYLYSGAQGAAMSINHRLMEWKVARSQNENILEIGGLAMPHCRWIEMRCVERYTLSDTGSPGQPLETLRSRYPGTRFLYHDSASDPDYRTLAPGYSRIIASHVLEHIANPEDTLLTWISLLRDDGMLSIALPCDPGWLWRFGQLVSHAKKQRITGCDRAELDFLMTRHHINAPQRLVHILRFYFSKSTILWFPSVVPVVDFNLFCIIQARKEHFVDRACRIRQSIHAAQIEAAR